MSSDVLPEPAPDGASPPSSVSAQVALGAGRERRLHPLSWLFVLLDQLRSFALPLIALLFFGRRGGDTWEWFGLVGVGALTLLAVVRYYTYRFRVAGGELVIRSGLLHKNVRHIPLERIQNVALKRNLLHRAFGVAEVRLESAVGGVNAEAQMKVLSLRDAHALEVLARAQARAGNDDVESIDEPEPGEELLRLPPLELIKLGLTSNRGLLLGAAGAGVFTQFGEGFGKSIGAFARALFGYARELHLDWVQWLVAGVVLVGLLVLVMRAVSVLLVLLQHFGFRLSELDQGAQAGRTHGPKHAIGTVLSVEGGLVTRIRSHAPLRKIQHWTLYDGLLHRWFDRRSLRVETAVLQVANEAQALSDLVPIAPPERIDALLARWLPWLKWDEIRWQPLHPRAWRRLAFFPVVLTVLACVPLCARFGAWGLLLLALLPWWIFRARRVAARASWAITDRVLMRRSGWWERKLSFAEIDKLQGLQLLQSPFDRRHGMASLVVDTAGASPLGHRLELHYLPETVARALHERLGAQLARHALKW